MKFVEKEKIAISKAKVLFTQKKKGIIPETVDHFYKKRVEIQRQLKLLKRKSIPLDKESVEYTKLKHEIDNLNITQHTIKILINTIYGYFGNKHSPLGDDELAESITLTGQAVIKESNRLLEEFIRTRANLTESELREDTPIIYNDTDSSYVSIKHIVRNTGLKMLDSKGKVTAAYYKQVQDMEDHLNQGITKWGHTSLGSIDCRLIFKREAIADAGLFLQKKRYVLHVLDEEGIPCDKFKYTGVEVVRTTMPAPIKPYVKKIIETMLMTRDLTQTNKIFNETYDLFKELPVEDIAFVMGIKGYEKYAAQCDGFNVAKHMPIHVRAAYFYNMFLEKFKIERKYESLSSGDKVRYLYARQPNRYGINIIGYKYTYPKEFKNIFELDREKMFEKIIFSVIDRFYEAVNWKLKAPGTQVQTDLFDLLKMSS
jgi:DNA polymerase elongation subunit (family B)